MVDRYLHRSGALKAVFLLVDIRHAPSDNDRMMYQWMASNGYDPIVIATKLDKIKRSQVQKQVKQIRTGLDLPAESRLIPFSATTKQGREEIWDIMEEVIAGEDPYGNHSGK